MDTNLSTRTAATTVILMVCSAVMAFFLIDSSLGRIEGLIIDRQTGDPVIGAVVVIEGSGQTTTSDSNGRFKLDSIATGYHVVRVKKLHYADLLIGSIELKPGSVIDVTVRLSGSRSSYTINEPAANAKEKDRTGLPTGKPTILGAMGGAGKGVVAGAAAAKAAKVQGFLSYELSPVNGQKFDDMFHTSYGTNPFIDTAEDSLSTFGADVSTGSYALVRNYLTHGALPPKEAFRVEEFINYFPASYEKPLENDFAIYTDNVESPISKNARLLRIGIRGREVDTGSRKPADLTFVIDVSGSMSMENRLGLVKSTLLLLLKQLKIDDRIGIVTYGSDAEVVLSHTSDHEAIENAIRGLVSNGSTNAEAGLWQGYKLAAGHRRESAISRVILCTDGVANNGETSSEGLLRMIDRYRKSGITLTACGFGMGNYNDVLIEQLATKGDGTYYYIDDMKEARRVFVEQLTGTLQVIARDMKIQVAFDPKKITRYRLLGYEKRDVRDQDFRNDKVDGGEIGSGHTVTALYEVKTSDSGREPVGTITIRYKTPDGRPGVEVTSPIKLQSREQDSEFIRFIAAATFYCEIMRESYWTKHRSVHEALGLLDNLSASFRRSYPMFEDFRDMVRMTLKLQEGKAQGEQDS